MQWKALAILVLIAASLSVLFRVLDKAPECYQGSVPNIPLCEGDRATAIPSN